MDPTEDPRSPLGPPGSSSSRGPSGAEQRLAESRRLVEERLAEMRSTVEEEVGKVPRRASLLLVLLVGAGGFALAYRARRPRRASRPAASRRQRPRQGA